MTLCTGETLIPIDHDSAQNPQVVGHKFANLALAHRHGEQVPRGVCIPVRCHDLYRREGVWSPSLEQALLKAARKLGLDKGGVAVRSSATMEDLEDRSFAGQYASTLEVRDAQALKQAVQTCWQAVNTEVLRQYLGPRHLQEEAPRMGVIIQAMVQAEYAGVVFSRHPVADRKEEMVAEMVPGTGENLVSGKETPIRCRLSRTGKILEQPWPSLHWQPPDHLWSRLVGLTLLVEECFSGQAVDIEWAVDKRDALWLLQARPITAGRFKRQGIPSGIWTRKIADDLWADRMTPFLAHHMVQTSPRFDLTRYARRMNFAVPRPTLGVIDGFLYINCYSLAAVLGQVPRRFRTRPVRGLFPAEFDLDSLENPTRLRLASLCLRAGWLSIRTPQSHPLFSFVVTRAWLKRFRPRVRTFQSQSGDGPVQTLELVDASGHSRPLQPTGWNHFSPQEGYAHPT